MSLQSHVKTPVSVLQTKSNLSNGVKVKYFIICPNLFIDNFLLKSFTDPHIFIYLQVFLGFMWIYCIILATSYSSNLIAFLTISRRPKPFETMGQLLETDANINTQGGSKTLFNLMSTSTNPVIQVSSTTTTQPYA